MKKAELLALGVPEENLKTFQELYHQDLRKTVRRMVDSPEKRDGELRSAIVALLVAIQDTGALRAILATTADHYLKNYREEKEEAQCLTGESAPDAERI